MIEEELFNKYIVNTDKLITYGFKLENNKYIYEILFMDNSFKAIIEINNNIVIGKVIDLSNNFEYTLFRREGELGEFASSIKSAYISILNDIKSNCFTKELFISSQANRITKLIYDKYNVEPEFLWDDSPDYGVFRNKRSNKWFGIIMNIDKSKIIEYSNGLVEIINIKLDNVSNYLNIRGIYPAYHMNKKSWVSIILDDTLSDNEIMDLINISYDLINISTNYIIPANPKYYDIVSAFNDTDIIMWKQPKNILINDYVYLYIASPYSCIMYKCIVVDKDIPYQYHDNIINMDYIMKIKLIKKYNNEFTLDKLKEYGIKTIRGPRSVPPKLLKELNK